MLPYDLKIVENSAENVQKFVHGLSEVLKEALLDSAGQQKKQERRDEFKMVANSIYELKKEADRNSRPVLFLKDMKEFEYFFNLNADAAEDEALPDVFAGGFLHFASQMGDLEIVKILVENLGFDVNKITQFKKTPLNHAAQKGHADVFGYLLENGANLEGMYDGITGQHNMLLLDAVSCGDGSVIKSLLEKEVVDYKEQKFYLFDPNFFDRDAKKTPLLVAIWSGKVENVRLLLDKGANVNFTGREDRSPPALFAAVSVGDPEIVRLLIEKGADVKVLDIFDGLCPLNLARKLEGRERDVAKKGKRGEVVEILIKSGAIGPVGVADPPSSPPHSRTPSPPLIHNNPPSSPSSSLEPDAGGVERAIGPEKNIARS